MKQMYDPAALRNVMGHADQKAALAGKKLPKSWIPRLSRYVKELLSEGVHPDDIKYGIDRAIDGDHSPFLVKSFAHNRGVRGLKASTAIEDDPIPDPWGGPDFPDYMR